MEGICECECHDAGCVEPHTECGAARLRELEDKVERLTSRGIEDMQHRIRELEDGVRAMYRTLVLEGGEGSALALALERLLPEVLTPTNGAPDTTSQSYNEET